MLRFLFTRRWLGLLAVVLLVGYACVELGIWQFHRSAERHDSNEHTKRNLASAPVAVDDILSTSSAPQESEQWTVVEAIGRYDPDRQIRVVYRTRDGSPGVDVVVPLVTDSGAAVLVDRGWVQTTGNANEIPDIPAPPSGQVTVQGWLRLDSDRGGDTTVNNGTVRAISSQDVAPELPYPVYEGFLDLTSEDPPVPLAPAKASSPDLGGGPSFFYGMQWFFFALLAFGFWIYFAWAEYQQHQGRGRTASQSAGEPAIDGDHRAGEVAGGG